MLAHAKGSDYRADIDGLRALAVLLVIGFHAYPTMVPAGFVGVDIFFVISGYLISSKIAEELQHGSFSFFSFYGKRIRRIFPSLVVTLVCVVIIGWLVLLPVELKQLGKHALFSSFFLSNYVFWSESGYFDTGATVKPLLHLWSLGIEEQFYLLWPLFLWFFWKNRVSLFFASFVLVVFSLGYNLIAIQADKATVFFSPFSRFWELGAGAALALIKNKSCQTNSGFIFYSFVHILRSRFINWGRLCLPWLSVTGLTLIGYSLFLITPQSAFPGWLTLLPVIGTVLIIAAGPTPLVNRVMLSNKVLVRIGVFSYPLYLIHWPLLSFQHIINHGDLTSQQALLLVSVSIVCAVVIYYLVEYPLRFKINKIKSTQFLIASMLFVFFISCAIFFSNKEMFFSHDAVLAEKVAEQLVIGKIKKPEAFSFVQGAFVLRSDGDFAGTVLFVGDSHATHYWHAMQGARERVRNKSLKPYSAAYIDLPIGEPVPAKFLADKSIHRIVFSYFWAYRYGSDKVDYAARGAGLGPNRNVPFMKQMPADDMAQLDERILSAAKSAQRNGKEVVFILDNPFGVEFDPFTFFKRSWMGYSLNIPNPLARTIAIERTEPIRSRIISIAGKAGATIIDPMKTLCNGVFCPVVSEDGVLMYRDYDHISPRASSEHVRYLDPLFE